jgi:hypothetical protein
MADDFFGRFAAIAVEGMAVSAAPASTRKGRYAIEIDLRWAAAVAVLIVAASGWVGYILGHGAHP